jgi:hypothetical protein
MIAGTAVRIAGTIVATTDNQAPIQKSGTPAFGPAFRFL